ncbi:hypothetical protein ACH4SP_05645 [Streptomyces sp. NPDC021093]|uniref:hypothetical protein n=1 Tax=Streptomyces sp. NPDC021093 TaxID=3365112 RepID=UPI0037A830B7
MTDREGRELWEDEEDEEWTGRLGQPGQQERRGQRARQGEPRRQERSGRQEQQGHERPWLRGEHGTGTERERERVEQMDRADRGDREERDEWARAEQPGRRQGPGQGQGPGRGQGREQGQDRDEDRGEGRGRGMRQGRANEPVRGQGQGLGPGRGQRQDQQPLGPLIGEYGPPYVRRSGQIAAVMRYNNGGHSVVWPDRREDVNKPWIGSPYTIFEVLLGMHVTSFDLRLPANGDAAFFDATARVRWEVEDPLTVVRQNVWDVGELLHDELLAGLRSVSRRFRLTDSHRADDAVRAEVEAGHIDLGRDLGLTTRVHVFIDLSEEVKTRVQARHDIVLDMDTDAAEDERERLRALRKREAVRVQAAELQRFLRQGDAAEIAYQMATNPEKQWEIREAIRRERREGQADFIGLFHKLLDTGNLERHDIGDHMYEVLQYLRENSDGVLGGVTDSILPQGGGRPGGRALENGRPGRAREYGDHGDRGDYDDGRGRGRELEGRGDRRRPAEPARPYWEADEPAPAAPERRERGRGDRELGTRGPDGRPSGEGSAGDGAPSGPPEAEWPDEEQDGRSPHVYEPTRVASSAERRRERERREREREQDWRDRSRDRARDDGRDGPRGDDGARDRDWTGDDRYRDDRYGDERYGEDRYRDDWDRGSDSHRDRGPDRGRDNGRAYRPSAGFDDWDEE